MTALDLEAIVSEEMRDSAETHELDSFEVAASSEHEPRATVGVRLPSGDVVTGVSSGDGPVDAIFGAIQNATGTDAELREYLVAAVTGGDDALGQVTVMLRAEGETASGQGVATDILEASGRAYVRALANLLDGDLPQPVGYIRADRPLTQDRRPPSNPLRSLMRASDGGHLGRSGQSLESQS